MKKFRLISYISLITSLLIVVFFYVIKPSNSIQLEDSQSTKLINDDSYWKFIDDVEPQKEIKSVVDPKMTLNEEYIAPIVQKEDPLKIIKQQEAVKGVSKQAEVKEEVKKYETNETSFGIDVSEWQGRIDWKQVKKSGISFVMIRCGFRKLISGEITIDSKFYDNIKGAIANDINVGVYFYSVAINKEEALEEARWVANIIKDYDITYPVAIDTEIFNQYRLEGVSYETLTTNAIAFCDYIKGKGYTPMIYSYARALNKYFETGRFGNYRIWLAEYNESVTYPGNYHMWQYTSSGSVPGINGRVDMNVAYFSVTNDVTKKSTITGANSIDNLEKVEFEKMEMTTKLTKEVLLRSSPYSSIPNKAGTLPINTNIKITGINENFIKIEYQDNDFYINDLSCFEIIVNEDEIITSKIEVITNKEIELLSNPYKYLNEVKLRLGENEEMIVIGLNKEYTKVLYNDEEYFVNDIDFYDIVHDYYNGSRHS